MPDTITAPAAPASAPAPAPAPAAPPAPAATPAPSTGTPAPATPAPTTGAPPVPPAPTTAAPAAPPAPATTPAAPKGPLSKMEARRAAITNAKTFAPQAPATPAAPAATTTPAPATPEPAAAPVEPTEPKPATEAASSETPAPAPGAPPAPPTPETTAPPPTPLRIEIPAEHPATRGKAITLTAASQEEADALRALVNGTYYRNKDVQERDTQILTLKEQIARYEAGQSAVEKWRQTPEYAAAVDRYHQIKDTVGPEAASDYWKGVERNLQDRVEAEFADRWGTVEAETSKQAGIDWASEAQRRTDSIVPPEIRRLPVYADLFQKAIVGFDAEIGAGLHDDLNGKPEEMHKAFVPFLQARLLANPEVRAALGAARARVDNDARAASERAAAAQRERKAIEDAAVERYKREAAQVRTETPPNPLAPLGGITRAPVPAAPTPEPVPATASPHQIRRAAKLGSREDARRHFPGAP